MAERPAEREEAKQIAEHVVTSGGFTDVFTNLARAHLALLAAYEDRSKAFERAAADCVRLEGALGEARDLIAAGETSNALHALDAFLIRRQALEAEAEQHAHAEHLREARERQEEKHGE